MKRVSALILLIAIVVVFSWIITPLATADKTKKSADSSAANDSSQRKREVKGALSIRSTTEPDQDEEDQDPDLPPGARGISKETYMRLREEYTARLRGIEPGLPFDPSARGRAITQMERQESRSRAAIKNSFMPDAVATAWTAIGPAPLPNGFGGSVSGRVTAVVVDPTNPNTVYLGAAQGGVWRSLDGGATWASIFDSAQSLAIGALALAPSDHTILYVGTGEFNACADCFFGAGLYRIDNANTTATLVGPINPSQTIGNLTYNIFNGRSISKILVAPNNAATIFVATAQGVAGSGANSLSNTFPPLATRGVYRSTNATAQVGSVTFQKLVVTTDNSFDSPQTGNVSVSDMVMEPGTANNIVVSVIGINTGLGGIYRTTNALSGTPTFTQALSLANGVRVSLAINNVSGVVTVYAGTSETPTNTSGCASTNSGAVHKSTDGGATWTGQLPGGGGFCSGQCFYDMPIAVDPNNANVVYIGGQTSSTCGGVVRKSTDGGNSFANDSTGLHPDDHALFFDGAGNIYTGNDGGVWKRSSSVAPGTAWTNLNNAPLNTLQFESVAVHPTDQFLTIGGTQDNGTEAQQTSSGNWRNAEGGDGGYTLIDQSATDNTNVTMYLTFFNQPNNQIYFDRATLTSCLNFPNSWPSRGTFGCGSPLAPCPDNNSPASRCDNLPFFKNNGIQISDNVLFYAPMALGPGTPNTLYFGTDRLYRSTDRGDNMTIVGGTSTSPLVSTGQTRCPLGQTCPPSTAVSVGTPISTIAISPQDDNYRVVGMQNGQVFATSTGSSTLVDITSGSFPANPNGSLTNKFVGRAVIDPNNKDVAYVAFSFFAPAGRGVWKITNLGAASGASPVAPIWAVAGSGIPSIPINAFAVDPLSSNLLYAGTDIGVYVSADGGASWNPFGTGLPRVAVFGVGIQPTSRTVRIATHGRGMWEIPAAPTSTFIQFSAANYNANEGDISALITVNRTGDLSGTATVDYASSDGTAKQNSDYEVATGTLTFGPGIASQTFSVLIVDDAYPESSETLNLTLSNPIGASLVAPGAATVTIIDNDSAGTTSPVAKQFVANLTGAAEVPANASTATGGAILQLNANDTSALFSLIFSGLSSPELIARVHGPSGPTSNAPIVYGPLPQGSTVTNFPITPSSQQVADLRAGQQYMNVHSNNFVNGEIRGQLQWNPMEEADFFVRQTYFDFLSRTPDSGGFTFWTAKITDCQSDVQCLRDRRIDVSNEFYSELEFQQTGAYVYRLYRAAYGNRQPFPNTFTDPLFPDEEKKMPSYPVFIADRARVIGSANLAQSQLDLATAFVQRAEFLAKYPASLNTADLFVPAVLATVQNDLGAALTATESDRLKTHFNSGGRALVMFDLANDYWNKCPGAAPCAPAGFGTPVDNRPLIDAEYNRGFVVTEYWGYLRRNPDIPGFRYWLDRINSAPLRNFSQQRAMVCVFITSAEFQFRFGPVASRNNTECQ